MKFNLKNEWDLPRQGEGGRGEQIPAKAQDESIEGLRKTWDAVLGVSVSMVGSWGWSQT